MPSSRQPVCKGIVAYSAEVVNLLKVYLANLGKDNCQTYIQGLGLVEKTHHKKSLLPYNQLQHKLFFLKIYIKFLCFTNYVMGPLQNGMI